MWIMVKVNLKFGQESACLNVNRDNIKLFSIMRVSQPQKEKYN